MLPTENSKHDVIDLRDFVRDFSRMDDPSLPEELKFWSTLTDNEKDKLSKDRSDMWKTGQGHNYLEALSKARAHNAKNKYWLPIFEKEMRDANDEERLGKVLQCLSTYRNYEVEGPTYNPDQWQE